MSLTSKNRFGRVIFSWMMKALPKTVHTLLLQGVDFGKLAKENSKDTGSGAKGGDLGWNPPSFYVAEFAAAAMSQEIGEIGEPVKTEFGYHIIQVIDRQERPLTEAALSTKREKSAFTEWLAETRAAGTEADTIITYDIWKEVVPTDPATLSQQPNIPQ